MKNMFLVKIIFNLMLKNKETLETFIVYLVSFCSFAKKIK